MSNVERMMLKRGDVEKVMVGEWSNTVGPPIPVDQDGSLTRYLDNMFAMFSQAYQPEEGFEFFFYKRFGLPSPIIRIDMPLVPNAVAATQGFFEIESRPAGLGVDSALFEDQREALKSYIDLLRATLGKELAVKVFPYEQSSAHDPEGEKKAFAQSMGIPFFGVNEMPADIDEFFYFVYGNKGDSSTLEEFESRSLFPVRDDGNKNYLVSMGAAKVADRIDVSKKLSLGVPFALKPRKGMWAQNVQMYPGDSNRNRFVGYATKDEVHSLIGNEGAFEDNFLVQPFFRPGVVRIGQEPYLAMARIYGLANPETGRYEVSNGIYVARQNIRLHGTSDAITGKLVFSM